MTVILTQCSCGEPIEVRTGEDVATVFRSDRKQAIYPGTLPNYVVIRCRNCNAFLPEVIPEYRVETEGP